MPTNRNESEPDQGGEDLGIAYPPVTIDGEPLTVPVRRIPEDRMHLTQHLASGAISDGTKFTVGATVPGGSIMVWFNGTDGRCEKYLVKMRDVVGAAVRAWEAKLDDEVTNDGDQNAPRAR